MSKTISWPARATYIFIALALALSLVLVAIPAKTDADPGLTKWSKVSTPQIDYTDWKIRQDSNIVSFDMGPDGETLYALLDTDAGAGKKGDKVLKSTDHGATWSDKTAKIQKWDKDKAKWILKAEGLPAAFDSFDLVVVAPEDADFVAVAGVLLDNPDTAVNEAGWPAVVFSDDGATKFHYLGDIDAATKIYSMDVSTEVDDAHFVVVGTDGKVFINEVPGYAGWQDYSAKDGWLPGQVAVTSVAFSPIFDDDETVLAISTDNVSTYLQSGRWGTTKAWNKDAGSPFPDPVKIVAAKADYDTYPYTCSGIALPSDYDGFTTSLRKVFVYVDTVEPKGYLFRIDSSKIFPCPGRPYGFGPDLDGEELFASLAYHGAGIDGKFMLGAQDTSACCVGVQVWRAEDIDFCCPEWSGASKKPTGQKRALVKFTPDGKKGYAATSDLGKCRESAFSVSWDDGKCWNQLSLIDTAIDYLSDVGVNGECSTTLLFSVNEARLCGCDSVWFKAEDLPEASEYNDVWLREFCKELGTDQIGLIRLAPEETGRVFTVYLVDQGTDKVWYNASSGITKWLDRHCTRIDAITDLAVESESIIYALGDDDMVSRSTNNGKKWAKEVDTKVGVGHTIAALADGNVLVGPAVKDGNRKVAYSSDGAATFSRTAKLPSAADGNAHVAFDTYFLDNDTIYAAVDNAGIYRWVIDVSTSWKDLKAATYGYYGIVTELSGDGNPKTDATHGGVLYAAYDGGVARCLTPAHTPCCAKESWDYLSAKLGAGVAFTREPSSLRLCGCLTEATNSELWAIDKRAYDYDAGEGRLWTYEDCFAKDGITLKAVDDGATVASDPCICANEKFVLEWERLCNACEYEFDISLDDAFTQIVRDEADYPSDGVMYYKPAKGEAPSVVIDEGDLDCNTKYYWRVRAHYSETDEKIQSWWSDGWSFTVEAGPTVAIDLIAPEPDQLNVPITNVGFTWSSVADADSYDWVLSANADLSSPLETKTGLTGTAYTYTGTLDYDAAYFWRVTAMKDGNVFSESDVSTFYTAAEVVPPPPYPELVIPSPVTPAWVWVVIGIGAVLVIVVIVLIFRTRRV